MLYLLLQVWLVPNRNPCYCNINDQEYQKRECRRGIWWQNSKLQLRVLMKWNEDVTIAVVHDLYSLNLSFHHSFYSISTCTCSPRHLVVSVLVSLACYTDCSVELLECKCNFNFTIHVGGYSFATYLRPILFY